ncbi:MAG: ABC transporter ATP-binding protein, partial [Ruthenibacterium sp.]
SYTRWDAGVYADYLQRFSLPTDKRFKDFSRGMKMKLAIAVALSHAPRLLILDEATSGLDPIVRDEVLDIFSEFTRDEGHSILLSSHILSDLEKLCDYIAFLHRGKLLFCEEKDRLLETYAVYSSSREALDRLPEGALCRAEIGGYHCRSLVLREKMPAGLALEPASVEDIVLFLGKENKR